MTDGAGLMPRLVVRLAAVAAAQGTVGYGALARDLECRMADLTAALESLMEADTAEGRPLRAALCEARLTPGLPAPGFFEKASALGFDIPNPEAFVGQHRRDLYAPA